MCGTQKAWVGIFDSMTILSLKQGISVGKGTYHKPGDLNSIPGTHAKVERDRLIQRVCGGCLCASEREPGGDGGACRALRFALWNSKIHQVQARWQVTLDCLVKKVAPCWKVWRKKAKTEGQNLHQAPCALVFLCVCGET